MRLHIKEFVRTMQTADEAAVGKIVNTFADLFRGGADLRTLVPLLKHADSQVVSAAAWIASEAISGQRGREIFEDLCLLLNHPDPAVRVGVIESVAILARPTDKSAIRSLFSLAADPNRGVRGQAMLYLCCIPDSIVGALRGTVLWSTARLLLANSSKEAIKTTLQSPKLFDQRMAVAGALRNYGDDRGFVHSLSIF